MNIVGEVSFLSNSSNLLDSKLEQLDEKIMKQLLD